MKFRHLILAGLAAGLLLQGLSAQSQPNSATAGLLVNGATGNVSLPVRSMVSVTVSGAPYKRFFVVFGQPLGFSVPTPAGYLEITPPPPYGFGSVILDGFSDPTYNTGPSGSATYQFELPAISAVGLSAALQGVVEDPTSPLGLRLTSMTVGTSVPSGTGGPQFLFFIPILGAEGTLPIIPEAGTMPGDMPEMDSIGEVGPTVIFDQNTGLPVYTPFGGPFVCASCHNVPNVYQSYMGTMMAMSARDPIFKGAFAIACADLELAYANGLAPGGKEVAADICIRCHSPVAWQGGRSGAKGDGVTTPFEMNIFDEMQSLDQEGIVCEVCHRALDYAPTIAPGFSQDPTRPENGQFIFSQTTTKQGPFPGTTQTTYPYGATAYGALLPGFNENLMPAVPNVPVGAGTAVSPAHNTEQNTFTTSSKLCGTCHNVTVPLNGFGEQRTYTEWENSDFGDPNSPDYKTCQQCHMEVVSGYSQACNLLGVDSTYGAFAKLRNNLPEHRFAGANVWVPQLFKILYPNIDQPWTYGNTNFTTGSFNVPASRDAQFDAVTNDAAHELGECAQVDMTATENTPNVITANVSIENKTGHKLPTGYPEGRAMWIRIEAKDANGVPFYQSGLVDAQGELVRDANIKVYEAVHGVDIPSLGLNQVSAPHLALANMKIKDNRIHPKGFVQQPGIGGTDSYDPVLAPWPVGGLYPDNHYIDTTTYSIVVPPNTPRPIKVTATVFHRVSSFDYIDFLANGGDAVNQTMPHPAIQTVRSLWIAGTSRPPSTPVGFVGPNTPTDPSSPYATAMRIIP